MEVAHKAIKLTKNIFLGDVEKQFNFMIQLLTNSDKKPLKHIIIKYTMAMLKAEEMCKIVYYMREMIKRENLYIFYINTTYMCRVVVVVVRMYRFYVIPSCSLQHLKQTLVCFYYYYYHYCMWHFRNND